ncbi:MAG TPA: thioredoxin [Bacteroidales bacterium]|nr:thioredoxin [Bacteroidales bacterium]
MKTTILSSAIALLLMASSCGNANPKSEGNTSSPETTTTETAAASGQQTAENPANPASGETGKPIMLTKALFLEKVYDFEKNPDTWVYKDSKPCIIDFYADWCRPCRMVAPIMEEFAQKYAGQITIYKINTDQEKELAGYFGIRSIPSVLFCPANGKPQMTQGALPKEEFEKIISQVLLVPSTK